MPTKMTPMVSSIESGKYCEMKKTRGSIIAAARARKIRPALMPKTKAT
jgi:hypothetical protein